MHYNLNEIQRNQVWLCVEVIRRQGITVELVIFSTLFNTLSKTPSKKGTEKSLADLIKLFPSTTDAPTHIHG